MSKRPPVGSGRASVPSAKSAQYQKARAEYDRRKRAVAPLVAFNMPDYEDATQWARRKVKRYAEYLYGDKFFGGDQPGIASGVKAKVRRKDPKQLAKLQREQHQGQLPGIKYAFVPTVIDRRTRKPKAVTVTTRKGAPDIVNIGNVSNISMRLDLDALLVNAAAEVNRVADDLEDSLPGADVFRFQIQNGESTIAKFYTRKGLIQEILYLMNRYESGGSFVRKTPSRHWSRWLHGVTMHGIGGDHGDAREQERELNDLAQEIIDTRERNSILRTIRQDWGGVLDALDKLGGHAPTEPIARAYSGDAHDAQTLKLLEQMRIKPPRLVSGDSNRWSLTTDGKAYVRDIRAALPYLAPKPLSSPPQRRKRKP